MAGRYEVHRDRASGIRFFFAFDPADPEILHIYARHLTTPREAIATFFAAEGIWNSTYRRYETHSATHALYWYWLEKGRAVMVVTCFRLEVK